MGLSLLTATNTGLVIIDVQDRLYKAMGNPERVRERWIQEAGAIITSAETVIFQMLKRAGTPEFKRMLKVVK